MLGMTQQGDFPGRWEHGADTVPFLEVRKRHVFTTTTSAVEWDPHGQCLLSSCPKPGTVTPALVTSSKGLGWVSNQVPPFSKWLSLLRWEGRDSPWVPGTGWWPRFCLVPCCSPWTKCHLMWLHACAWGACSAFLPTCWTLYCPSSENKLCPNKALGPRSVDLLFTLHPVLGLWQHYWALIIPMLCQLLFYFFK